MYSIDMYYRCRNGWSIRYYILIMSLIKRRFINPINCDSSTNNTMTSFLCPYSLHAEMTSLVCPYSFDGVMMAAFASSFIWWWDDVCFCVRIPLLLWWRLSMFVFFWLVRWCLSVVDPLALACSWMRSRNDRLSTQTDLIFEKYSLYNKLDRYTLASRSPSKLVWGIGTILVKYWVTVDEPNST